MKDIDRTKLWNIIGNFETRKNLPLLKFDEKHSFLMNNPLTDRLYDLFLTSEMKSIVQHNKLNSQLNKDYSQTKKMKI